MWDKDREAPTPQKERHPPNMYVASSDFCTSPRKAERSLHRPFLTTLVWSAETRRRGIKKALLRCPNKMEKWTKGSP